MRELRNLVVGLVVLVVVVDVLTGQGGAVVSFVTLVLREVDTNLKTVMVAVALPALLVGGLIYVSPWHRDLAIRLMTGAAVVLAIAVLGPAVLHWLQVQMSAWGDRMFGGQP